MSLSRQPLWTVKPYAINNTYGVAIGLGQMIGVQFGRAQNGVHWHLALLWHSLSWQSQQPMWYRDMVERAWRERDEAKHQAWEAQYAVRQWAERSSVGHG